MTLNAEKIRDRLAATSSSEKDDIARDIIKKAKPKDLSGLDCEGVMRLFEALALGNLSWYSGDDKAATKRLAVHTQFRPITSLDYGVNLVRASLPNNPIVQTYITPKLVRRLYAAEHSRLSWYEHMGIDGDSVGRGQLIQRSYVDVKTFKRFKNAYQKCITRTYVAQLLNRTAYPGSGIAIKQLNRKTYRFRVPEKYRTAVRHRPLEDFVVAGYLAIRIIKATKPGRSPKDTVRFAVALYHGMRKSVVPAQEAVNDKINWAPVQAELLRKGQRDQIKYVTQVVQ